MGRTPCCLKVGLNRGPWTPEEDDLLAKYIQKHGEGGWRTLPKKAGLVRCGKSCRLRWMNYLRPDVKRGQILPDEEDIILRLHRLLGNRWSLIAGRIPGRTDNEIKNFWNTHLSRKLVSQGIDPRTHKPLSESELENHDDNNVDSEDKLGPAASYHSQNKYPQTPNVADNIDAASKLSEYQHSPEFAKDSQLIEISVTGSLNVNGASKKSIPVPPVFHDGTACNQHSRNALHMNPTFIPYSKAILELGLQDHDASLYMRRNSVTNSYFMAPPIVDSGMQSIPYFPDSINGNAPFEGFPMNFEQSEMQQHQELPPNTRPITQTEDYSSDTFQCILKSFMDEDQLHDQTNKHAGSSLSENRQQFTPNPHLYEMWSIMSPQSQNPERLQ